MKLSIEPTSACGSFPVWAGVVVLVCSLASCDRAATGNAQPENVPVKRVPKTVPSAEPGLGEDAAMTKSMTGVVGAAPQVSWRMTKQGDKLRIHYTVKNTTASSIWLVDDLVVWGQTGFVRAPKAAVVRNSDRPGTVSFYRGDMYLRTRQMRQYPRAGIRELKAHAELAIELELPLPLAAWHYYHPKMMPKLESAPTHAVLELQYIVELEQPGTEVHGGQFALEDGSKLTTPRLPALQRSSTVRTAAKPLPTGS